MLTISIKLYCDLIAILFCIMITRLYCTANSYTRLNVRSQQREEFMVRFAPRSGSLPLV